jgi:hypothetical protein
MDENSLRPIEPTTFEQEWTEGQQRTQEMLVSAFTRGYLADFAQPTEEQRQMEEMAEAYFTRCNYYDATVCSGISPRSGEPIPFTARELGLVNQHASRVRKALMQVYDVSEQQFHKAIVDYNRRTAEHRHTE